MPVRAHRKSRKGCRQCKVRKVKCDETPVKCHNCEKRGIECSFAGLLSPPGSSHSPQVELTDHQQEKRMLSPPKAPPLQQESRDIIIESLRSDAPHSPIPAAERFPSDHLLDLELLHHYTTVLCPRVSEDVHMKDIWQRDVIREALQHEFLLHGILSLAAVHIISITGDFNKWRKIARIHQEAGLTAFIPALDNLNKDNSHALFIFSTILAILSVASPMSVATGIHLSPVDKALGLLVLLRGVRAVVRGSYTWIASGSMGYMLRLTENVQEQGLRPDVAAGFDILRIKLDATVTDNSDTLEVYKSAILTLEETFSKLTGTELDSTTILNWSDACGDGYIALLKQRQFPALAILAYYGVLLHRLKHEWWIHAWGLQLIEAVELELSGGDWSDPIGWAKGQTMG